jgi:hypothetical protein
MLHRRSAGMGRLFPRKERPQRTSSSGGTRRSIQGLKKELPTDFLPAALLIFYLSNPIGLKHHCLSANHTCHSTRYGNNKFQNHIPRFLHKDYPLSD